MRNDGTRTTSRLHVCHPRVFREYLQVRVSLDGVEKKSILEYEREFKLCFRQFNGFLAQHTEREGKQAKQKDAQKSLHRANCTHNTQNVGIVSHNAE